MMIQIRVQKAGHQFSKLQQKELETTVAIILRQEQIFSLFSKRVQKGLNWYTKQEQKSRKIMGIDCLITTFVKVIKVLAPHSFHEISALVVIYKFVMKAIQVLNYNFQGIYAHRSNKFKGSGQFQRPMVNNISQLHM
ncbi:hypothetical protein PPERSA_06840 [Pseudocohnilembus persalinus]|uniref:Uncharacterized protein n=1 Tax=Pseudocohnilembus persalinus TaxID=266149 RepID=A0A0V0QSH4_PSEPJ|nr:hypothetical protein PPERSA_06840 [Pseudocohnilembus persalinus]|eukprot:KRX05206.1 hypothetical protein PPERSA_06840 [Pseudocohnilembus persalinus]